MKKRVFAIVALAMVVATSALCFAACGFDDTIQQEVVAVTLTVQDGYSFDLNEEQIKFFVEQLASLGEFSPDAKYVSSNWSFDYEYRFKTTTRTTKGRKTEENVRTYNLGTIATYKGQENKVPQEWSYTVSGVKRDIVSTSPERAKQTKKYFDDIVAARREAEYAAIKNRLEDGGYSVQDLPFEKLSFFDDPKTQTQIRVFATKGYSATDQQGNEVTVFFCTRKMAKECYTTISGTKCAYDDIFFAYGTAESAFIWQILGKQAPGA